MAKDVHTEHCCIIHGCKYSDEDCTVTNKKHPQSYPCETCGWDNLDPTKGDPTTSIYNFKTGHFYKLKESTNKTPSLIYIMGLMGDENRNIALIAHVYMPSNFLTTGTTDFVSGVQGVRAIKESEWEEVTKEVFEELKAKYTEEFKMPCRSN